MIRCLFTILLIVIALSVSTFGQTTPAATAEPTPTPKPAIKRRGLDQFGLSSGVLSSSGSESLAGYESADAVSEPVASNLGDLLRSVGDHLQGLETGYRQAYEKRKEARFVGLMAEKYVFEHLVVSFASPAALRKGVFEGQPFKNHSNAALFQELRVTVDDLLTATLRMQRDQYPNASSPALELVEKYSVPTFQNEIGQSMFVTRNLVLAIFARARGKIARLERQIVVVR